MCTCKNLLIISTDGSLCYTSCPTEVIVLENTLNGTIMPQDEVQAVSDYAHSQGIKMHLDGARLWHVASITATPMKYLCDPFDSVSLCLSKGLGECLGLYTYLLYCIRPIFRCAGGVHFGRQQRFYHKSPMVQKAFRRRNAADWCVSRVRCLRTHTQLSFTSARSCSCPKTGTRVGRHWGGNYKSR